MKIFLCGPVVTSDDSQGIRALRLSLLAAAMRPLLGVLKGPGCQAQLIQDESCAFEVVST